MKRTLSLILCLMLITACVAPFAVFAADPIDRAYDIVYARSFSKAPVIDGTVTEDEWGKATKTGVTDDGKTPYTFAQRVSSDKVGLWASDIAVPGQKMDMWFRWDKDYFYLAIVTPDTVPMNKGAAEGTASAIWNGDAIQFKFDPDGNGTSQNKHATVNGASVFGGFTSNIAFALSGKDGKIVTYGWSGPYATGMGKDSKYVIKNDGAKTTYELAIAWKELLPEEYLAKVKADNEFGMSLCLLRTDNTDTGAYDGWLTWGDGVCSPQEDSCRAGSNKVILSATDAKAADSDPTPSRYTVTFKSTDGSVVNKQLVYKGESAYRPTAPKLEGYKFDDWDKSFANITADTEITAKFKKLHTVIFQDFDGKQLKKATVEDGKKAAAPKNPSRDGYTFTGWDSDFSAVTADMTVVAQYEEIKEQAPDTSETPATGAPATGTPSTGSASSEEPSENNNVVIIIVVIAVIAVAAGVIIVVAKKKK